jgi:hypothetical protein
MLKLSTNPNHFIIKIMPIMGIMGIMLIIPIMGIIKITNKKHAKIKDLLLINPNLSSKSELIQIQHLRLKKARLKRLISSLPRQCN